MNVLQVGSSLHGWAGIERYVMYLVEGLAARGHQVATSCAADSPLARNVSGEQVSIRVRQKFDLRATSQYIRLFRARRFEVVHAHFNADFWVVGVASRIARMEPLVMSRHVALPWTRFKAKQFSRMYDCIIPVSEAVRRRLATCGVPEAKMRMAKAGCPSQEPLPDPQLVRTSLGMDDRFQVGYFGRLAPEKGIDVLMRSLDDLGSEVVVNVFGSGPLENELAKAAGSNSKLRHHGFRADVSDCLAAVDAVVIPSTWEEAFPFAALQAMAAGKPIVASNIGGLPELVAPGVSGLLFPPGDSAALAECVSQLAADRALSHRMGDSAREIQRADYTIEKMAERIEGVYEALLQPTSNERAS